VLHGEKLEKTLGTNAGPTGEDSLKVIGAQTHVVGHGVERGLVLELLSQETDGTSYRILV
jgi:hypothetical protein